MKKYTVEEIEEVFDRYEQNPIIRIYGIFTKKEVIDYHCAKANIIRALRER